jgi:hypothetical protein
MNYPTRIDLCEGKYSVIYDLTNGVSQALRYGEPWKDLRGDKMTLAMFDRIVELEAEIARRHGIGGDLVVARKERDEFRQDAERYRWLRDVAYHAAAGPNGEMVWCVTGEGCGKVEPIHGQDLDDAINATINCADDGD